MKTEIRHKRKAILHRLDRLELERCNTCKGSSWNKKALVCSCPAAVEIRGIGVALIATTQKTRKNRIQQYIEQAQNTGLTMELYRQLRELEITGKEIQKRIGMTQRDFAQWKIDNDIVAGVKTEESAGVPASARIKVDVYGTTPYQFEIAKRNGITRQRVKARRRLGWSAERSISEPVSKGREEYQKWLKVALANGLTEGGFKNRMSHYDMSMEDAATLPKGLSKARVYQ